MLANLWLHGLKKYPRGHAVQEMARKSIVERMDVDQKGALRLGRVMLHKK